MPCQFSLGYVSSFEPRHHLDPQSDNSFGDHCQFNLFSENEMQNFDGKTWCPFHLPLTDSDGNESGKRQWGWNEQAYLSGRLAEYIEDQRQNQRPIDLCGLMHWDRLTFAMTYSTDRQSGSTENRGSYPSISLDGARFPRGVDFSSLQFSRNFFARNTFFGATADFSRSTFSNLVEFSGAVFEKDAIFFGCCFGNHTDFSGARFHQAINFAMTAFPGPANFSLHNNQTTFLPQLATNESIKAANFWEACFSGPADFSDRKFLSGPDFHNAQFSIAPAFHNCDIHQSVNFDEAGFFDTSSPGADRSYRSLKLAMEKMGARDEQALFFSLEQKSRAKKNLRQPPFGFFPSFTGLSQITARASLNHCLFY